MMNTAVLGAPVLVLNASYEPINVCAARRALVLLLKGVAAEEEPSALAVHSTTRVVSVPSVIRLLEYRRIPRQTRSLSRKNILVRDRYTCQYCTRTYPANDLTLDHVVARSRGGQEHLGEPRGLLPPLQQPQGRSDARGSGDDVDGAAATVYAAHQPQLNAAIGRPPTELA